MSINKLVFVAVCCLVGCGRYGPPLAPEALAPQAVSDLQTTALVDGVHFAWTASNHDVRGKDLKTMDGYRIYRKEIVKKSDIVDPDVEYTLLATIEDKHVEDLKKKQEDAKKEGKISRRVKADPKLTKFEYLDSTLEKEHTYLYKFLPINQGGVEGGMPKKLVKVLYRADQSEVSEIDNDQAPQEEYKPEEDTTANG
jgi:hypothetical protein